MGIEESVLQENSGRREKTGKNLISGNIGEGLFVMWESGRVKEGLGLLKV